MRIKRKIRLPRHAINMLQDLRDSYPNQRPIPQLVTACLKQTRGVECLNLTPTPRDESEQVCLTLDPEFAEIEHASLVARVCHALIGIQGKLLPDNIRMNRYGIR